MTEIRSWGGESYVEIEVKISHSNGMVKTFTAKRCKDVDFTAEQARPTTLRFLNQDRPHTELASNCMTVRLQFEALPDPDDLPHSFVTATIDTADFAPFSAAGETTP